MRTIDADALIRRICGAKCGCEHEECGSEGDCNFEYFIFSAPTITTESLMQHGHWYRDKYGGVKCSVCNYCVSIGGTSAYRNAKSVNKFCPNCGAKMEEST